MYLFKVWLSSAGARPELHSQAHAVRQAERGVVPARGHEEDLAGLLDALERRHGQLGAVALEDGAGRYRRRSNPTTPRLR